MRVSLLLGVVVLLAACGGRSGGGDGGASDLGGGDAGGSDGGGSDGGGSDAGGTDAGMPDAGPSCPATAPTAGMPCSAEGQVCIYDVCPSTAFRRATCIGGGWSLDALACDHTCTDGTVCNGGDICVERRSGAVITTCEPNPCGMGALDCSCAASLCGGGVCRTDGIDVTCTIDCGGCP